MTDENNENLDLKDPKIYEIGYLLSPLIAEADKADRISAILVTPIEENGATVISQTPAQMRKLAYKIGKTVNHKKTFVTDAYFGAIKFSTTPDKVANIKDSIEKNEAIIRILLIEIPPQSERSASAKRRSERKAINESVVAGETETETKAEVDNEKIDLEIEELLAN